MNRDRRARGSTLRGLAVAALGLALACGDDASWIRVTLDIAAGASPFADVVTVRLSVSGQAMDTLKTEVAYEKGVEIRLSPIPSGTDRVITVEGLDIEGVVLSRGQSKPFEVTADSPEEVRVTFTRCTGLAYRDADGDGYGDSSRKKTACASLTGYVAKSGDCNDSSSSVHPGQTKYFSTPIAGSQSYDYDCNQREDREHASNVSCSKSPCGGEGWSATVAVPGCGASAAWATCQKDGPDCKPLDGAARTQACR